MEFDIFRPIYIQIVEELKYDIIKSNYKSGDKLPPVRVIANIYRVNPNTVQRAFVELENEKLVYADRTNGRYVTKDEKLIENLKETIAIEKTEEFVNQMNQLGISYKEIVNYLKNKEKGIKNGTIRM